MNDHGKDGESLVELVAESVGTSKGAARDKGLCKSCCAWGSGEGKSSPGCMALDHGYGEDVCPRLYERGNQCNTEI
jgi:hypothetical protein